ncbi:uncharacterized protein TNCV_1625011 [Trichonephila clavipes]|nr:uncharacterized protein TNCV_1625011 [Trichonephila clavipes]
MLQCILRERFWICKSRRTIRSVVTKCTKCRKYKAEPMLCELTPLPADRIENSTVFERFEISVQKSQLIQRHKQNKDKREPRVGETVLVGNDSKKRINWRLAVIVELVPGRDGNVRTIKVKTQTGVFLRPIQRIFPLEIDSNGYHSLDMKGWVDDGIHDLNAENRSPEQRYVSYNEIIRENFSSFGRRIKTVKNRSFEF